MPHRAAFWPKCLVLASVMALAIAFPALAQELSTGQPAGISFNEPSGGSEVSSIAVPEAATSLIIDLQVAEGSPEMSLGVNFGSASDPDDPASWECSKTGTGSLVCQFDSPAPGVYYILTSSLAAASGTLTATYFLAEQPDNNSWQNANMAAGETKVYSITLPEGTNQFKANLHVSFGSAVLFAKAGAVPSGSDYDCTAYSEHGNAQCIIHRPLGGVWFVSVLANEDSLVNVQLHYTENQGDQDGDGNKNNNGKEPKDKDKDKTNNGKSKNK